jgi:hypothetical protein
LKNADLYKSLTDKYRQLFDFLTPVTGYKSPINLMQVTALNGINRELIHGLKQPDWVYKRWPQYNNNTTLDIVTDIQRIVRSSQFNNIILAHLRGGYLLNDWVVRAKQVAKGNQASPSHMLLYSSVGITPVDRVILFSMTAPSYL